MRIFCSTGVFEYKRLPLLSLVPLAGAYVGYVVLNNLNLRINTARLPHSCQRRTPLLLSAVRWLRLAGWLLPDIQDSCGACSACCGGHLLRQAHHKEGLQALLRWPPAACLRQQQDVRLLAICLVQCVQTVQDLVQCLVGCAGCGSHSHGVPRRGHFHCDGQPDGLQHAGLERGCRGGFVNSSLPALGWQHAEGCACCSLGMHANARRLQQHTAWGLAIASGLA